MIKRLLIFLICALAIPAFGADSYVDAKAKSKKKQKTEQTAEKETPVKKKESKYDKNFVKDKNCITAKAEGGFMTLHKLKGRLYVELPLASLGREMLIASTITGTSASDLATVGYKPTTPMHVKFSMVDSTIYMSQITVQPDYDKSDVAMAKAVGLNEMNPIIASYKMFCRNNDSTAVVFDLTSMFKGNHSKLAPVRNGGIGGGVNLSVSFEGDGSYLGDIKAFSDNVTIKSTLSYIVSADVMKLLTLKKNEPLTVDVTRTILLLPEQKMRSRAADSRVGIFLTNRRSLESDTDAVKTYSIIRRWDVQPSDSAAYARGELVEPLKPIVFYLDDAFPAEWREPAKRGALRWNKAFEEIGFKNVVQVRDFPADDPDFDPDNLKYSCIRYVPSATANAMGPSWFDPVSGEIINASVIVYNDVVRLVNNWRFCQTAQIDPEARAKRLSEDLLDESMEYVVAHEVGHCLGFMHNMAASAAYPVDSLRSATFTAKNGTTASIMDYARFNYVAQPGDEGVKLTPPYLGPYDYYIVKYAYQPIPGAESMEEEAAVIEKWVDEKAGDPLYRYGRQQLSHRYDPSAIEEDLGDDPVKAADYGISNLKYILKHFDEWMPDEADPDASLREARYKNLLSQYNRYLKAVMLNVGGIYLTSVKPGTEGEQAVSVPKARQSESLKWVVGQIRNCGWLTDRELTDKFTLRTDVTPAVQYNTAIELFNTSKNVILSSHLAGEGADAYTLRNWLDDIYASVWESAIKRRAPQRCDRIMQNLYITYLTREVVKKGSLIKASGFTLDSDSAYLPSVDHIVAFGLDETGVIAANLDVLRALEEEKGQGYVASQLALNEFGKAGYGWQSGVNVRSIDESKTMFHGELMRISRLLKSVIPSSKGDAGVHYEAVLYQIDKALQAPASSK